MVGVGSATTGGMEESESCRNCGSCEVCEDGGDGESCGDSKVSVVGSDLLYLLCIRSEGEDGGLVECEGEDEDDEGLVDLKGSDVALFVMLPPIINKEKRRR